MTSRSRLIAKLIDAGGDIRTEALDNVTDVDEVVQSAANSTSTSAFVIDSVPTSEVKAVTFRVAAFSSTDYQYTTINAILNNINNDCDYNEFGTIESSEISTYEVRVSNTNIELLATPESSGITYRISRISLDG